MCSYASVMVPFRPLINKTACMICGRNRASHLVQSIFRSFNLPLRRLLLPGSCINPYKLSRAYVSGNQTSRPVAATYIMVFRYACYCRRRLLYWLSSRPTEQARYEPKSFHISNHLIKVLLHLTSSLTLINKRVHLNIN